MWLMLLNFPNVVQGPERVAKVEVVSSNLISRSKSRPLGVGFLVSVSKEYQGCGGRAATSSGMKEALRLILPAKKEIFTLH
jgi:hypothetical protein